MTQEFIGRIYGTGPDSLACGIKAQLETYVETRDQFTGKPWVVGWRGQMGLPLDLMKPEILGQRLTFDAVTGEKFEFFICGWRTLEEPVRIEGTGAWPGKGDPFNED